MIEFRSRATAPLIMLDDSAFEVLTAIGKGPVRQGIITVEQLPDAIERLAVASAHDKSQQSQHSLWPNDFADEGDDGNKPSEPIRFTQRAWPFLEMLRDALKYQEPVVWGV